MEKYSKIFNQAMDLACYGIYEKKQLSEKRKIYYSGILKKALDKFVLLNYIYSTGKKCRKDIFPNDESALIKMLSRDMNDVIDEMPDEIKNELVKTEWYYNNAFVNLGKGNCFYCSESLLDEINDTRKFSNVKNAKYKELELNCYYFIEMLFEKTQEEYLEIRDFFEQRNHAFITDMMYRKNEYIRQFKKKYKDVFKAAYEQLSYKEGKIKICKHCGLVLRELADGTLYCVSEMCSQKSKGFEEYNEIEISGEVSVLKENVARFIYYPGILEQKIKKELLKNNIEFVMWPNKDAWDFEMIIGDFKWAIDVKDVKNPRYIIRDIHANEKQNWEYDKILYVVPSDRNKAYLNVINNSINNKEKYECITFTEFQRKIKYLEVD